MFRPKKVEEAIAKTQVMSAKMEDLKIEDSLDGVLDDIQHAEDVELMQRVLSQPWNRNKRSQWRGHAA